ncbi:MAG TPA: D-glycero-beta-D-manno-heptose 1-phosphate adenylyltransferase [Calditrichia bacterium]|nr:D-glycero-beta-D-manno-heptose 1-phosphate adenylyltransferase [Calditrichota bacterium]HQU73572.1 D-glycero-beta-D-manno-heptose 1-phosphate adenylyltransferase [Calditrichia bacterium]HQV31007.1 D-glycero-beta-D-manno-heptose 1-phosphate adenylyltransferase [Calditrichia bacterium]
MNASEKIMALEALQALREQWRRDAQTVVFTNGCFDILHRGHVEYLEKARSLGDRLILGLNSDASVFRLKGEGRPIVPEQDRAAILAALASIDAVVLFGEDTPARLIETLLPDYLVKGGDYRPEDIVGAEAVLQNGGAVTTIPFLENRSTTTVIQRIIELTKNGVLH